MSADRREESLYRLPARRGERAAVGWRVAALLALGVADGGWLAGGWMARRFGYAAGLGRAWVVRPWYPDRWLLAAFLAIAGLAACMALAAGARRVALALVPVGVPVLIASWGPLYSPWRAIAWMRLCGGVSGGDSIVGTAAALGGGGMAVCFAAAAAYGALSLKRLQRVGDLHGSSHWASVREAAADRKSTRLNSSHRR